MKWSSYSVIPSSRLSRPRIQSRSPWPPRLYDPSAHGGIRSGLSFPPCSALCGADAWFLSPVWRSERGSQQADPNPQRRGPLPVCCLCRFAPCSVFSVGGKTFSITGERTWMVALLVGLHVGLVRSRSSPHVHHRCIHPKPTITITIPLFLCCLHLFSRYNRCLKVYIYSSVFIPITLCPPPFFWSQEVRSTGQDWWSFDPDGAAWEHE